MQLLTHTTKIGLKIFAGIFSTMSVAPLAINSFGTFFCFLLTLFFLWNLGWPLFLGGGGGGVCFGCTGA